MIALIVMLSEIKDLWKELCAFFIFCGMELVVVLQKVKRIQGGDILRGLKKVIAGVGLLLVGSTWNLVSMTQLLERGASDAFYFMSSFVIIVALVLIISGIRDKS